MNGGRQRVHQNARETKTTNMLKRMKRAYNIIMVLRGDVNKSHIKFNAKD